MNNKNLLIILYKARDYQKDPDPEHWRTISGAKVHLDNNGEIDGGAGGKFTGNYWDGKKGARHIIGPHNMINKNISSGATAFSIFGKGLFGRETKQNGTKKQTQQKTSKNETVKRNYNSKLSKGIGKEHYDKMLDSVEKCNHPRFKTFWETTSEAVDVGDIHYKGDDGAHADGNAIFLDIKDTANGNMYEAPYQTAFHESAHAIDHNAGQNGNYFSVQYKNGLFAKTIIKEINEHVNRIADEIKKEVQPHVNDPEWLFANGFISKSEKGAIDMAERYGIKTNLLPYKFDKKIAYKRFDEEIDKLDDLAKTDIGDIIRGATKTQAGHGHKNQYWKDMERVYGKNSGLAVEAFAEMTSATTTNPKSLMAIKKYVPKSYALYEEMIEEITKNHIMRGLANYGNV